MKERSKNFATFVSGDNSCKIKKGGAQGELYYTDAFITSFEFAFLLAVTMLCTHCSPIRKQK